MPVSIICLAYIALLVTIQMVPRWAQWRMYEVHRGVRHVVCVVCSMLETFHQSIHAGFMSCLMSDASTQSIHALLTHHPHAQISGGRPRDIHN